MELPQAHLPGNTRLSWLSSPGFPAWAVPGRPGWACPQKKDGGECESQWDWSLLPELGVGTKKKHGFYLEINSDSKPKRALGTEFLLLEGVEEK